MNNKTVGRIGEDMAEMFLISRGYGILKRNYRTRFGEIDIIAKKDEKITFVEVKTRFSNTCGIGREAVDYSKLQHIKRCANDYISKINWNGAAAIDVIEINLTHLMNIE